MIPDYPSRFNSALAAERTPREPRVEASRSAATAALVPMCRSAFAAEARVRRVRSGAIQSPRCSASFSASTASGPPKRSERLDRAEVDAVERLAIQVADEIAEERRRPLVAHRRELGDERRRAAVRR